MAKQFRYRVKAGGAWSDWRSAVGVSQGRCRISSQSVVGTWSQIEIEEYDSIEVGDQYKDGIYAVTVISDALDAIYGSGEEYKVFSCRFQNSSSGSVHYQHRTESDIQNYERA